MKEGKVELGLNGQATARMLLLALVVGGAVGAALLVGVKNGLPVGEPVKQMDAAFFKLAAYAGGLLAAAAYVIVLVRQPRGARIEWNEWGVTEWDGDAVRTAIRRDKLRVGTLTTVQPQKGVATVTAGDAQERAIGRTLVLGDSDDRRIYASEGVQLVWLNDRLSTAQSIAPLREGLADVPGMTPELGRQAENRAVFVMLLGILAYLGAFVGTMPKQYALRRGTPEVVLALLIAVVFGGFRALVPWLRARRLSKRNLSVAVTLLDNDGTRLTLQQGSQTLVLDPAPWKHADDGLLLRRGPAWLSPQHDALETAAARKARLSRVLSLKLEVWGRLLLPLGAALVLCTELRDFEKWKIIVPGAATAGPVVMLEYSVLRRTPAGIERVWERGKHLLPGTPDLVAVGPDGTIAIQTQGRLAFRTTSYQDDGWELRPTTPLPTVRAVFAWPKRDEKALLITSAGEAQIWKKKVINIELERTLPKPFELTTAVAFDNDQMYAGLSDGRIILMTEQGNTLLDGSGSPVVAIAAGYHEVLVADTHGITVWSVEQKRKLRELALPGITTMVPGIYPTWTHVSRAALLVLTADNELLALDDQLKTLRHFKVPTTDHTIGVKSDNREVVVGTDHGALYQLWIN